MARNQNDYLKDLLANEGDDPDAVRTERGRGTTLLGRETALNRVASGEVSHVTQLRLDPVRVRVWSGNPRFHHLLNEENCRDLIDAIIAEGGQKVAAIVRKVENNADYDYEVVAGARRHFAISWLRKNSYPEMKFLAQVAHLDDEAAFRLADIENRARKDVSDFERAKNYANALKTHYDGHLTRMAERLRLSKGWLSKVVRVAQLPFPILKAFGASADIKLKPAYSLLLIMEDKQKAEAVRAEAALLEAEQNVHRRDKTPLIPASEVFRRLTQSAEAIAKASKTPVSDEDSASIVVVQRVGARGVTVRIKRKSGLTNRAIGKMVAEALDKIEGRNPPE